MDPSILKGNSNSHLPENGWIQPCLICDEPTSRTFKYFYNRLIFTCYFCKDCLANKTQISTYNYQILISIYDKN
jgi:hypothetical protein